jgi:hypothetical protein
MIKYVIATHFITDKIKEVNYDRETTHFCFYKSGMRDKKKTEYSEIYDNWEDAHKRLIEVQSDKVEQLKKKYAHACELLDKIKRMKKG